MGRIEGRVLDDKIRPMLNATVAAEGTAITASSSGDGWLSLQDVPAGNHVVWIEHEGYEPYQRPVTVVAGTIAALEVTLVLLPSYASHNFTHIFAGH